MSSNFSIVYKANRDKIGSQKEYDRLDRVLENAHLFSSGEKLDKHIDELTDRQGDLLSKGQESAIIEATKANEFNSLFGDKPYYKGIIMEQLIAEIALILFVGGFAFILFCAVLKKKHMQKTGIIYGFHPRRKGHRTANPQGKMGIL